MWIKEPNPDSAKVQFPPPIAVLLAVGLAWLINTLLPVPVFADGFRWYLGGALAVAGFALILFCVFIFKRADTGIPPWVPTSKIVVTGPYQYTRNPIYLGMIVTAAGLAIILNGLFGFSAIAGLWAFLNFYVIPKEEGYLAGKFGSSYADYCVKVRRWL